MTKNGNLDSLEDLSSVQVRSDRLFSATHEEILSGLTSDVYFLKTRMCFVGLENCILL